MELYNLKPADGATHNSKRVGRGYGSGKGRTSTRGHKGAMARSGYKKKIGFEGGQMPLQRRVPKFGFNNINRIEYQAVNLNTIQAIADKLGVSKVGLSDLIAAGFVNKNQLVKVLAKGEITSPIEVEAHAFSAKAEAAISDKGGKAIKL